MLKFLVPDNVVQRHTDAIYEVMGELADIFGEEDGSSWSYSHKECTEWACVHFESIQLKDPKLIPKLTKLVRTWNHVWS